MKSIPCAAAVLSATLAVAAPAAAQSRISVGQTVTGTIDARDAALGDGSHYDCWVMDAPAGTYTVEYRSDDFDAFVAVGRGGDCSADEVDSNDDGFDDGLDSRLVFTTDGGRWFIRANTLDAGETGRYALSLAAGGTPSSGGGGGAEDMHEINVLCAAIDTLAFVMTYNSPSTRDTAAWDAESGRLTEAAYASGRALGRSPDQVEEEISAFGAELIELSPDLTELMGARSECLAGF